MYKRILVTTDGSTLSKKAVKSAIDLAALCGAELVALKVVPRYPQSYFEGGIALQPDEVRRVVGVELHDAREPVPGGQPQDRQVRVHVPVPLLLLVLLPVRGGRPVVGLCGQIGDAVNHQDVDHPI